jgi:hypothetical protein
VLISNRELRGDVSVIFVLSARIEKRIGILVSCTGEEEYRTSRKCHWRGLSIRLQLPYWFFNLSILEHMPGSSNHAVSPCHAIEGGGRVDRDMEK